MVERDGRGLRRIVDLAVELRAGKRVQSVELIDEVPGVALGLLPETAGMVKDLGGWETYRSDLLARLGAVGGVEWKPVNAAAVEAANVAQEASKGARRSRQRITSSTETNPNE